MTGAAENMQTKIIHLTDLHLGMEAQPTSAASQEALLLACIDDINTRHGDADLVVISGDLVEHGAVEEYLALRHELSRLAVPFRLLVGNHDDAANLRKAIPETEIDAEGDGGLHVRSVLDGQAGRLVFLDTCKGEIGRGQLEWLDARLTEAAGRPVYVFMHHPPTSIGLPALDLLGLAGPAPFLDCVRGRVAHMFCGHVHRTIHGHVAGVSFSAQRGLAPRFVLDFDATELRTEPAPPGYAVVLLRENALVIHDHEFPIPSDDR